MDAWIYLLFAFMCGLTLGCVYASLHFRTKVEFYRQFIERRLSSINFPGT